MLLSVNMGAEKGSATRHVQCETGATVTEMNIKFHQKHRITLNVILYFSNPVPCKAFWKLEIPFPVSVNSRKKIMLTQYKQNYF